MAYKQPQHDEMPQYIGFYVERAEVLPSEKDADPKWDAGEIIGRSHLERNGTNGREPTRRSSI